MTAKSSVRISGLRETKTRLLRYGKAYTKVVVMASLFEGAAVVQKAAKNAAPKKTGRLRRGIVLRRSKIHNGKRGKYGVFLTIRRGKGKRDPNDAYYGQWQEDGWNTHGKRNPNRADTTANFGKRSGRKTAMGRTDVLGIKFIKGTFDKKKRAAVDVIIKRAEEGAEVLARRFG